MAVVTVGGAYAVLAYVAQEAVEGYGWLTDTFSGTGGGGLTPPDGSFLPVTESSEPSGGILFSFFGRVGAADRAEQHQPSVVHQDVHPPERIHGALHGESGLRLVRDV